MTNPFSWKQAIKDAQEHMLYRAQTMAKNKCNDDFSIKHPDWVRDAQTKNYAVMNKAIIAENQKRIKILNDRRIKQRRNTFD